MGEGGRSAVLQYHSCPEPERIGNGRYTALYIAGHRSDRSSRYRRRNSEYRRQRELRQIRSSECSSGETGESGSERPSRASYLAFRFEYREVLQDHGIEEPAV